jgi:hypothetical protein
MIAALGLCRRHTIQSRSGIEPNSRELQIRFAHFVRVCRAGPFNAFFGHGAVLRGRFHGNAPIPTPGTLLASCVEGVTAALKKRGQVGARLYD